MDCARRLGLTHLVSLLEEHIRSKRNTYTSCIWQIAVLLFVLNWFCFRILQGNIPRSQLRGDEEEDESSSPVLREGSYLSERIRGRTEKERELRAALKVGNMDTCLRQSKVLPVFFTIITW